MSLKATAVRFAGLFLCSAVFAGTALAGDKPKDGAPGNSENAPGQVKQAEQPAQPADPVAQPGNSGNAPGQVKKAEPAPAPAPAKAAPGQVKKAEKQEAKAEKKAEPKPNPAKVAKPEKSSGSYKEDSKGTDLEKNPPRGDHKHTICHATGSSTNPYVVITPSVSGVFHGHIGHQDGRDIVPPFTYKGQTYSQNWDAAGQALFAAGCRAPAAHNTTTIGTTTTGTTTTTALCPGTTRTVVEIVPGGVFHKTGSKKNPYVFIQPSKGSAHYDASKHPDDIIIPDQTITRTVQVAGNCSQSGGGTTTTTTTTSGGGGGGGGTTTVTQPNETVTLPGQTTTVAGQVVTIPGQTVTVGGAGVVQTGSSQTGSSPGASGVAGAVSPAQAGQPAGEQPAGGVLGATAQAAKSLGKTAATGSLPFTGIPLWIAALIGMALLAAGLMLRRSA